MPREHYTENIIRQKIKYPTLKIVKQGNYIAVFMQELLSKTRGCKVWGGFVIASPRSGRSNPVKTAEAVKKVGSVKTGLLRLLTQTRNDGYRVKTGLLRLLTQTRNDGYRVKTGLLRFARNDRYFE
jgi:hypothetical protein